MTPTRKEAEDLIHRALQIVISTIDEEGNQREYTDDEMEDLMFSLSAAMAKFKKTPQGRRAAERLLTALQAEQERRAHAQRTEENPETD